MEPKFDVNGLLPVILQDSQSGQVLMLAYMNREALGLTLQTGYVHFWSRSRRQLWLKGATSGNRMHVLDLHMDCDGDALLICVKADGPACHTGAISCFFNPVEENKL